MSNLKSLWEQQYANDDGGALVKEAASFGMTPDEYLKAVARQRAEEEEQAKIAAENEFAAGLLVSEGIQRGIAAEFTKMAARGGNAQSCELLKNLFVQK